MRGVGSGCGRGRRGLLLGAVAVCAACAASGQPVEPALFGEPRRLPDGINSPALEFCPSLSPDGRTFYFTSTRGFATGVGQRPKDYSELTARLRGVRNGLGNIYQVPMTAVRPLN